MKQEIDILSWWLEVTRPKGEHYSGNSWRAWPFCLLERSVCLINEWIRNERSLNNASSWWSSKVVLVSKLAISWYILGSFFILLRKKLATNLVHILKIRITSPPHFINKQDFSKKWIKVHIVSQFNVIVKSKCSAFKYIF